MDIYLYLINKWWLFSIPFRLTGEGNGIPLHSSILAWRIPWAKEPGGLQSMRFQRVRHDLANKQQLNYIYFSIYHGATCTGGPICLWSWRWIFVSAMWKSECLTGQDTEDVYHFNSKKIKQQVISPLSFCLSLKWAPSFQVLWWRVRHTWWEGHLAYEKSPANKVPGSWTLDFLP